MLTKLIEYMKEQNLEGFFVSKIMNVRYISTYTSDDAYLLITEKGKYLITDPRYTEQAQLECPDYRIINWREKWKSVADAVKDIINSLNIRNFAFEGDAVNYNMFSEFSTASAKAIPLTGVIEEFRAVKTPEEIHNLRVACQIADRAFDRIIKDIRVGVTEKELASKLSHYMVMEGADTKG